MALKTDGYKVSGKLNYETTYNGRKLVINELYSLSSAGFYFSWKLEKCGFGQFSIGKSSETGKWMIDNECMSLGICSAFVKALEDAIKKENNSEANYCVEKIKKEIYKYCETLEDGLAMIWLEGTESDLEFDKRRNKENSFKEDIPLGELKVSSCVLEINEPTEQYPGHERISFILQYDYFHKHFGKCYISWLKVDHEHFFEVSKNFDLKKFKEIFSVVEKIEIENLQKSFNEKQIKDILKIKSNWDSFKNLLMEKQNLVKVEDIFSSTNLRDCDYSSVSK